MTGLAETVSRLEREALAQLDAVLAGTALCRVDGTAAGPAKHWEGRSAALAQVRRALRREPGLDPVVVVASVQADWLARFGPMAGPAWSAYTDGGLTALGELTGSTRSDG